MKVKYSLWLCCFVALFFAAPAPLFGQGDSNKFIPHKCIILNAGVRLPVTPFTAANVNPYAGLTGYSTNISASCPILRKYYLNVVVLCGYGVNKFDASSYQGDPNFITSFQSGSYKETSFLGGFLLSDPVTEKVFFDFEFSVGGLIFTNPEITSLINGGPGNPYNMLNVKSSTVAVFVYNIGVGFRRLEKRSIFSINLDAIFSNSENKASSVSQYEYRYANGTVQVVSTVNNNCPLKVFLLDITLGVGYRIGK